MFVEPPQVSSLSFHKYLIDQMGFPLPNTNATVWSCMRILSLHLVPPFVVVINCGDAKCIVIAGVFLVANVGQWSCADQITSSLCGNETTLVFDVRMGHAEATTPPHYYHQRYHCCWWWCTQCNCAALCMCFQPPPWSNFYFFPCWGLRFSLYLFYFPHPFPLSRFFGVGPKHWGRRRRGVRWHINLLCHLWDICIISLSFALSWAMALWRETYLAKCCDSLNCQSLM